MVYLTALSVAQNDGFINDKLTKNDRRIDIEVYLQIIALTAAYRNAGRNGAESTTETGHCCHLATELLNRSVYRTDGSAERVAIERDGNSGVAYRFLHLHYALHS
jgi:hypothetical protein